jgi:hypothetical protein
MNYAWAAGSIVTFIMEKAKEASITLEGPADTEHGWGWCPTTSFWSGERRVHLYGRFIFDESGNRVIGMKDVVEVSDRSIPRAQRLYLSDEEATWDIIRLFVGEQCAFDALPGTGWISDNLDYDKFIPHPPNNAYPGSIGPLIDDMKAAGATPWQPDEDDEE